MSKQVFTASSRPSQDEANRGRSGDTDQRKGWRFGLLFFGLFPALLVLFIGVGNDVSDKRTKDLGGINRSAAFRKMNVLSIKTRTGKVVLENQVSRFGVSRTILF